MARGVEKCDSPQPSPPSASAEPRLSAVLISLISIEMGIAVVAEAILSFVGRSVQADVPTWGTMIADGLQNVFSSQWGLILPTLCIVITVLATTLLGDGLRRSADPRLLSRAGAKP